MPRLLTLVLALLLISPVGAPSVQPAQAAPGDPTLADELYVHETGHHISGPFLRYWVEQGGVDAFGYPLTEQYEVNGTLMQYFERARFEYHASNPPESRVQLGHLGRELAGARQDAPFVRFPAALNFRPSSDRRFFPESGHFLGSGFKQYWEQNGGLAHFGFPISEEFVENGLTVQYFERARFEYHPQHAGTRYAVQLGRIGHTIAEAAGLGMAAIARKSSASVWPNLERNPVKWIEVDLGMPHTMTVWEGDKPVLTTYVSGGAPNTPTVLGTFQIYWKLPSQHMRGGTAGSHDYYDLPDVPFVMYFFEDYAFHGAYWHDDFGYPVSHGCVNLTPQQAEWLYQWAPHGTRVWIHD